MSKQEHDCFWCDTDCDCGETEDNCDGCEKCVEALLEEKKEIDFE